MRVSVRRCEPKLLPLISKGTVDLAALSSARVQATDYVAPADRYAVVPGAQPSADGNEVPQVRGRVIIRDGATDGYRACPTVLGGFKEMG